MVMFRDFTQRHALTLGLSGYVTNMDDGSVKVIAEGPENMLKNFSEKLRKGPVLARVRDIKETWSSATGEFHNFNIIYKNIWDRI
jgi:acylphosphatase